MEEGVNKLRKNEVLREIDKTIKVIENREGYSDVYKVGIIKGLELAKEDIKNFKRR